MEALLERLRSEGMARAYGRLQRDMAVALLREARALRPDALDWDDALAQVESLSPERRFGARELLERKEDLECVEEAVRLRPRRVWRLLEAVAQLVEALADDDDDTLELLDDLAEAARAAYVRRA